MSELMPAEGVRPAGALVVRGARTHNLKGVDLTLSHRQLIVVTGVSATRDQSPRGASRSESGASNETVTAIAGRMNCSAARSNTFGRLDGAAEASVTVPPNSSGARYAACRWAS